MKRSVIIGARFGGLRYDILIVATGVTHSYLGHDEFAKFAPGLKGLADALHIRNKVLQAFEQAEAEDDPRRHQDPKRELPLVEVR